MGYSGYKHCPKWTFQHFLITSWSGAAVCRPSPLHCLWAGQLPGKGVADTQHVRATVRQGTLLIQHQPVGNTREEFSMSPTRWTQDAGRLWLKPDELQHGGLHGQCGLCHRKLPEGAPVEMAFVWDNDHKEAEFNNGTNIVSFKSIFVVIVVSRSSFAMPYPVPNWFSPKLHPLTFNLPPDWYYNL